LALYLLLGECRIAPRFPPKRWKHPKKLVYTLRRKKMKNLILKSLSQLHKDEAGQGLVEYALIVALVGFAAVVGMNTLATDINNAFTKIGTFLTSTIP
jgi:pilus assembly protein Flp/PilA